MKHINDYINEAKRKEYEFAYKFVDAINGKQNDIVTGLTSEVAMPSFKDSNDSAVRTLSLLLSKEDKNKPEYILALWGGPDDGGMSMLDEVKKTLSNKESKISDCSVNEHTGTISLKYENKWWSIKVFTKDEWSNLHIER